MTEFKLHFGTSGIRELMGPGLSCLNMQTIEHISSAVAFFMKKHNLKTVVIGYDNRIHSQEFARRSAEVLASFNIKVYLLSELRPVPYLCYAIKAMRASMGVMITASHNPKEYNGYKVYDAGGAEILSEVEKEIEGYLCSPIDFLDAAKEDLFHQKVTILNTFDLDNSYIKFIQGLAQFPELDHALGSSIHIIYSSLHGTGITLIPKALLSWGFTKVSLVSNQCATSETFGEIKHPNPEFPENYRTGSKLLLDHKADVLLLNDADADRVGVCIYHQERIRILNGNEIATICFFYLVKSMSSKKIKLDNSVLISSMVTTRILDVIANDFSVTSYKVHTGFKFIAEKIKKLEAKERFLFGVEESYGFLLGDYIRDKDGIAAACFIAEIVLVEKLKNRTLLDLLYDIYKKYGVFRERQCSISYVTKGDLYNKTFNAMNRFRSCIITSVGGDSVNLIEDYENLVKIESNGRKSKIIAPNSNALLIGLASGATIFIRPSGTEPKLRIHISVHSQDVVDIESTILLLDKKIDVIFHHIQEIVNL